MIRRALVVAGLGLSLGLGGCAFQTDPAPAPAHVVQPAGGADFAVCATPGGCWLYGRLWPFLWAIPTPAGTLDPTPATTVPGEL